MFKWFSTITAIGILYEKQVLSKRKWPHSNYKYLRKTSKRNTKPTEQKAETTKYTKTTKRNTKPTKVWNISKNVKLIGNG